MNAETLQQSGLAEPRAKRRSVWRITLRLAGAAVAVILVAGIIAPHINAERFSNPIRRALEAWLGRKVEFQAVHFTLFSGPGFSLKNVLIQEDPRYGPEPFAYVPRLDARISWTELLVGKIRFSSVRLDQPTLNFAKRAGGSWNVLNLMRHVGAANSGLVNFFPAFEVSEGRIDFRLGTRKAMLYLADCDFSVSPQRSGEVSIQFAGWPARTDRAGMGFGHLRGTVNWYPHPQRNGDRLEAELTLDPSNLSEITTLFEGHDIGVYGTVSSEARIDGPLNALRISGDLHVDDIHRWDLFAANGENWSIRYHGAADLDTHQIEMETAPEPGAKSAPVHLAMKADHFLKQPVWSIDAKLDQVPLERVLPVARRLGMPLPKSFSATGIVNGSLEYSSAKGFSGALVMQNLSASVGGQPRFQTGFASATITSDHFHLDPANIQEAGGGTLEAGGDYYFSSGRVVASLEAERFSAAALKRTLADWFGSPEALSPIKSGRLTGEVKYSQGGGDLASPEPGAWSGALRLSRATLKVPALANVLSDCSGNIAFNDSNFSLTHFLGHLSGIPGVNIVHATYRYDAAARRPEQLRLQIPVTTLEQIQHTLEPVLRPRSLLARLRFTSRHIPAWLSKRNLQADVTIGRLSAGGAKLGTLRTHLIWRGPELEFTSVRLYRGDGVVWGHGTANLAADSPRYRFTLGASGIYWKEGLLSAQGELTTSGFGSDVLANLRASGTFAARHLALSQDNLFQTMQGAFLVTVSGGQPDVEASHITAFDDRGAWTGEIETRSDGKLLADLQQGDDHRRVLGTLEPVAASVAAAPPGTVGHPVAAR